MTLKEELMALVAPHDQSEVLRFFDDVDQAGQQRLAGQLRALDFRYLRRAVVAPAVETRPATVEPYQAVIRSDDPLRPAALQAGREALAAGRVGVLLVAGGAGSRLGFEGPKGLFAIGPLSAKSLFQLHLERIVAAGRRYGATPPLYLMTSPENHVATCAFLSEHQNFGVPADKLVVFAQGQAPAVDAAGKLLLAAKDQLVLAPNGNGGLFAAMEQGGAFAHMRQHGVAMISYVQVDNALADGTDPLFCGVHALREADFSSKAIPKVGPFEKVGNYALVDGKLGIVEYFEIPDALAESRTSHGELLFNYGNPGLFMWSRTFAEAQARRTNLPIHRAHKKIACLDDAGALVEPSEPNGFKLETFALDTLAAAQRPQVLAIERDAEFAPVKNASGQDSPESARALMFALYGAWLRAAGIELEGAPQVELSPLAALDGSELLEKAARLKARVGAGALKGPLYLEAL